MVAPGHVFHRFPNLSIPTAVSGDGPYIIDKEGKRYLDACGGAAVSCLGHSDSRVIEAIKSQLDALPFAHTAFFTNDAEEELAAFLAQRAPEGIERFYFLSGGSEAIETALKLTRQYFLELGQPDKNKFIARRQSYHGNTVGALSLGGNLARRDFYEPLLRPTEFISACYAYRGQRENESEEDYASRLATELEDKILELGPDNVAAFIAEPVVGATLGAVPAVTSYFKKVRALCDTYHVLLILDEIMCGSGRTGSLFACEQDDVIPDMVTMAKGLGAGYQPIAALGVQNKIFQTICDGSGFFRHGHTYVGHATACTAALATMRVIEQDNLLEQVRQKGALLKSLLKQNFDSHPHVGDIRGRGLLIGLELVADRQGKKAFATEKKIYSRIKSRAMENGLMCYPAGGTVDGVQGDHILIAPPYIINDDHIEEIVEKLKKTLEDVLV